MERIVEAIRKPYVSWRRPGNSDQSRKVTPVLKIDAPMAAKAVRTGSRIGLAVTFAPTLDPASRLLREAAEDRRVRGADFLCDAGGISSAC